jgi:hypothetical protein
MFRLVHSLRNLSDSKLLGLSIDDRLWNGCLCVKIKYERRRLKISTCPLIKNWHEYSALLLSNSGDRCIYALFIDFSNADAMIKHLYQYTWDHFIEHKLIDNEIFKYANAIIMPMKYSPLHIDGVAIYMQHNNSIHNKSNTTGVISTFEYEKLVAPQFIVTPFSRTAINVFLDKFDLDFHPGDYYLLAPPPIVWENQISSSAVDKQKAISILHETVTNDFFITIDSTQLALYRLCHCEYIRLLMNITIGNLEISMFVLPIDLSHETLFMIMREYNNIDFWSLTQLLNYSPWMMISNIVSADSPVMCLISRNHCDVIYNHFIANNIKGVWIS